MRYATIRPMDISNGEGIGVALFTQGCSIRCKGCFQPETWDFYGGKTFTPIEQQKILKYMDKPQITRFSILGGEPLEHCNLFELSALIQDIKQKKPDIKIWLYTGYTVDQLRERVETDKFANYLKDILSNVDVLVAGPFIEEEKDLSLKWCGSRNQQVLYLNKI